MFGDVLNDFIDVGVYFSYVSLGEVGHLLGSVNLIQAWFKALSDAFKNNFLEDSE